MPFVVYIALGAALTLAASASLGRAWLAAFRIQLRPGETWIFSLLTGASLWSTALFALAAAGWVNRTSVVIAAALAIALGVRQRWPRPSRPSPWLLAAAPFFVLYLANAVAPELSPDGSSYHLGLVSRYYRERGFAGPYENMYAHLSQGLEMLFLSAWALGRNSAAATVHFAFLCLLPLTMLAYGKRFGLANAALAAALLVFFTPVVGIDGISAYNDVAGAAVVFGVFYLIEIHLAEVNEPNPRLLATIGLLAGFAFAVKYTLGFAIPYALFRVGRRQPRAAIPIAAAALVIAAPWLIKNAILTGNPVAPLFNARFPNRFGTAAFEATYTYFMRHYDGITSYWQLPAELLWRGKNLSGFLGPVWLLVPLSLLALTRPGGRTLLAAGAWFGLAYFANIGTRFLIPALPFFALALASVLARWPALLIGLVAAHGITAWPDIAKTYSDPDAWRLDRIWYRPALRLEPEDHFLRRRLPNYAAARLIEANVPAAEAILTFNPEAEAYTARQFRVWYQSTENNLLGQILHAPLIDEAAPRRLTIFAFDPITASGIRITQTNSNPVDLWHATELRLYSRGAELPRAASWRIQANSNPWFAALAFDNDPLTRWSTAEPLTAGQSIEVRFPTTQLDRVVLESPELERSSAALVQPLVDGQWLEGLPGAVYRRPAPLGMRRRATRALLRHGIRWILIGDADFGAQDYFTRRADWGLRYVGAASGRKLYRIQD